MRSSIIKTVVIMILVIMTISIVIPVYATSESNYKGNQSSFFKKILQLLIDFINAIFKITLGKGEGFKITDEKEAWTKGKFYTSYKMHVGDEINITYSKKKYGNGGIEGYWYWDKEAGTISNNSKKYGQIRNLSLSEDKDRLYATFSYKANKEGNDTISAACYFHCNNPDFPEFDEDLSSKCLFIEIIN